MQETATDPEIVAMAWDLELTIVTANGDDFIKEINPFQKKLQRNECHELHGLVILPNAYELQRRVVKQIEAKLRFDKKRANWKDVADKNLLVKVRSDGSVDVTQFPQCFYCRNDK
jgi:hypothetical protein